MEKLLTACIAEQLQSSTNIAGCVVSFRQHLWVLSIWLTCTPPPSEQFEILGELKELLNLPVGTSVELKEHAMALEHGPSSAKRFSIKNAAD